MHPMVFRERVRHLDGSNPSPKHRRPREIAGGKPLKTDLRLEGSRRDRGLSTAHAAECDTSRTDHLEASIVLIDEIRAGVKPRRQVARKA